LIPTKGSPILPGETIVETQQDTFMLHPLRKDISTFLFIALSIIAIVPQIVTAQETPTDEQIAGWKTEADQFLVKAEAQQKLITQKQEQLLTSQREFTEHKRALKAAEETIAKAEETLKPLKEAVTKAEGELKPLTESATKAKEAAEAAKGTDQEKAMADAATKAVTAEDAAKKKLTDAQAAVSGAEKNITDAKASIDPLKQKIAVSEKMVADIQQEIQQANQQLVTLTAQEVDVRKKYQTALINQGKLVSFTHGVAPIFAKRCLACHNARTAKGRYNMETYAAIMKGGESGVVVDPGDGDLSTLFIMCEDGSMPKDSDPLSAEEIARIKKWINTGAILDAGISSSAELITVIPKEPQPTPPESYRVTLPVTALAFSPDGKQIASSGYHEVLIWNAETGELLKRISNVAERIYDLNYSPDGIKLAVAAGTPAQIGEAKVFDISSGNVLADLVRTGDAVFAVAFSPDGQRLAIGCADRSIRIYDANNYAEQLMVEDHADWVHDIAWAPDGSKLVSASRDKTAKIFNAQTGDSLITFNTHNNTVHAVAFTPDGKQIVSSGADRQLRIWNVADAKQARNIGGFADEVFGISVTAEGDVFSVSADKNARRHTIANGKAVKAYSGHADWVYALARHAESKRIATGAYDGTIRIWDENEAKVLKEWKAAPGLAINP
jgi:predicted  nucleic acid-binding Zn-ribbon protein